MPHIHEKIDFTVEVFIVFKNKVLLRMHDKYKIWLSVGGHIELNEDPIQAALREVKEEVGLDVELVGETPRYVLPEVPGYQELLAPRFLNRHRIKPGHEHIALTYFARSKTDKVVAGGSDKSDNWKWFTLAELNDPKFGIRPSIKFYAQTALKELAP